MKAIAVLVAAVAALGLPGIAGAKGSAPTRACGAEGCIELEGGPESLIFLDHDARISAPSAAPYYRLEYAAPGVGPQYFVADGSRLAVETAGGRALQWYALYGSGQERLKAAIRSLEPYEAEEEWPTRIERKAVSAGSSGASVWMIAALLLTGTLCALVAHRIRIRSPETA
jgi:hypothetical protein